MARSHETLWLAASASLMGVAGVLLGVSATLSSGQPHAGFWTSGLSVAAYVAAVLAVVCFIGAVREWAVPLTGDRPHRRSIPDEAPESFVADAQSTVRGPAITDRWRLVINDVSSEILQLQNNSISHLAYGRRSVQGTPPPSVRIGMQVACSSLDAATPATSDIRAGFLEFLGQPPMMDLVRELTDVGEGVAWRAWDDNPRFNFGAILNLPDTEEAPVAWARLLVPDETVHRYGRDSRCAYLVLYVEPRTRGGAPASGHPLLTWHQRFVQALKLPSALAEFLAQWLGLSTADDPPAEMGVWLNAPRALTELVEVDGFEPVPGSAQTNWFRGFARADPAGQSFAGMAAAWLQQMSDSALHLDGHDAALASLAADSTGGPRLVVRISEPVWDTWQQVAWIVALRVEVKNTTDAEIHLSSVGIGSNWGRNPPTDLPVIDPPENRELQQEVEALRKYRYNPELHSYRSVLPHASVSGWVVTDVLRPLTGGTPELTVSVREAVGHQYLTIIPRTDPQSSILRPKVAPPDGAGFR